MLILENQMNELCSSGNDVIVFLPKDAAMDDHFHFEGVDGIIRRHPTADGSEWEFDTLVTIKDVFVSVSSVRGDLSTVARAAEYQFGEVGRIRTISKASYQDSNFPKSLIPTLN